MEWKALQIVYDHIKSRYRDMSEGKEFELFVVWQCQILGNAKYVIKSTIPAWSYYELTFDRKKNKWYVDEYMKTENMEIRDD